MLAMIVTMLKATLTKRRQQKVSLIKLTLCEVPWATRALCGLWKAKVSLSWRKIDVRGGVSVDNISSLCVSAKTCKALLVLPAIIILANLTERLLHEICQQQNNNKAAAEKWGGNGLLVSVVGNTLKYCHLLTCLFYISKCCCNTSTKASSLSLRLKIIRKWDFCARVRSSNVICMYMHICIYVCRSTIKVASVSTIVTK